MIGDRYLAPGFAQDILDKNISTWFMEGMSDAILKEDIIYDKIANIREMRSPNDVVATFSGGQLYGLHQPMEKARTYEPGSGWKIRMYPQIYKNAFIVPGTVQEWRDYQNFVQMQSRQLGAFGIITLDYVFVNMLNNGFDPAYPIYDGEPLFSTTHVLKNAPGVFANRPENGSFISQDSIAEASTYFMSMPNDDGIRFSMRAAWLIITPSQFGKAMQVLGQTLDPAVANNGTPALTASFAQFGGPPKVIVSSKLTNPDAWFLLADRGSLAGNGHGLDMYFTPDGYPKTQTVIEQDPKSEKHIGSFRVAPTITKASGVWGNPGPGA
jgi:hypothetical protein